MIEGIYTLVVNQYRKRENCDVGFEVEVEIDGQMSNFCYEHALNQGQKIEVASFEFTKKGGLKIIKSLPESKLSKEIWGLNTNKWQNVKLALMSPNYWNGQRHGNRHFMFMLDGCKNDGKARGFYNEFLRKELEEHRRVFEMVGCKMNIDDDVNQLSGIGFSSTQRNSFICKVQGSFNRQLKVVF